MYIAMSFVCYVHQLFCIYERMDVISCSWNQGKVGNKEESKKETKRRKQRSFLVFEDETFYTLQHQDWNSKLLEECLLKIPIADYLLAKKPQKGMNRYS